MLARGTQGAAVGDTLWVSTGNPITGTGVGLPFQVICEVNAGLAVTFSRNHWNSEPCMRLSENRLPETGGEQWVHI